MKETYRDAGGAVHEVTLTETDLHAAHVASGDLAADLTVEPLGRGVFRLSDGVATWRVRVDRDGPVRHVTILGLGAARLEREVRGGRRRERPAGSLASPMPGTVVKVLVREGDKVAKGADLLVVEAMKMEIRIEAPVDGVVRSVRKREGEPCDAGEILVEVGPADGGGAEPS